MIKPGAVRSGFTGKILETIIDSGFRIQALKMIRLSLAESEKFYAIHKGRAFYQELTTFMSSGPIVAAILEKENAVSDYRKLIGATNPEQAEEGTIRKLYAANLQDNAVHGSDSDENARLEASFFFPNQERFGWDGNLI
jgi:nucleoside-diphosphate kinase